jgi:hypothetical protein
MSAASSWAKIEASVSSKNLCKACKLVFKPEDIQGLLLLQLLL